MISKPAKEKYSHAALYLGTVSMTGCHGALSLSQESLSLASHISVKIVPLRMDLVLPSQT